MEITFNAIGLEFKAEVTYKPFKPGKFDALPEHCYPSEPAEIEFQSLEHNEQPCLWLLDSHPRSYITSYITDAAMQAANEKIDEMRDEAAADAMEAAEAQR